MNKFLILGAVILLIAVAAYQIQQGRAEADQIRAASSENTEQTKAMIERSRALRECARKAAARGEENKPGVC